MRNDPARLKAANAEYLWHPMAHPKAMKAARPDIIVRGEGCWIWDVDGHRMIDGVAGLWSSNLGHSCREVRDAIVAQLDELPYYNTFRGTTHARAIELSSRVVGMMQPDGVKALMFSNGGSDAVESALKLTRQYWKVRGQPERVKFIALRQGYHGVHFGGTSLNGSTNFRRPYEPLMPGCLHVDTPWLYRNPFTDDPDTLAEICAAQLEREIVFQGPDTVAAFIAEPVQGAGGVIVPPARYWKRVREICDRHGVLLIADEVVTGFGRTGHLFGTRLWDVKADLWCLAKGISAGYVPLGATAIGGQVAEAFANDAAGLGTISHGYTYSAHPLAAAASIAALDVIERDDIVGNAARVGAYMQSRLKDLGDRHRLIGNVRGVGLMACVEMVSDRAKKTTFARTDETPGKVARAAYRAGAMIRISGSNIILSPPLIITPQEIDVLVDAMDRAFTEVEAAS